jgi:hypothetical protein
MVANPNSTMLLGNLPLFKIEEHFAKKNMGYLIHHHFFSGGH